MPLASITKKCTWPRQKIKDGRDGEDTRREWTNCCLMPLEHGRRVQTPGGVCAISQRCSRYDGWGGEKRVVWLMLCHLIMIKQTAGTEPIRFCTRLLA